MIVYNATKSQFNDDVNFNRISDIILHNLREKKLSGGQLAEYHSWQNSDGFGFGEKLGSNWWIALILGALLTIFGIIVILNPMLGLGVIGVLVGCSVITAGINLIYLGCSPWIL